MYAQYQYYAQQNGGMAAVSTKQAGLIWDGKSWSNGNTATINGTNSYELISNQDYFQQQREEPQRQHQDDSNSSNGIPPNPVHSYTLYYHRYTAQATDLEKRLSAASPVDRQAITLALQWSRYYADASSRAAHYFHSNPNAVSAPFELPPDPDSKNNSNVVLSSPESSSNTGAGHEQQQPSQAQVSNSSDADQAPNGLKEFVHNSLSNCSNEEEKEIVKKMVEKKIQEAFQTGTLHSIDWSRVPLVSVPRKSPEAKVQQQPSPIDHYSKPTMYGVSKQSPMNKSSSTDESSTGSSPHHARDKTSRFSSNHDTKSKKHGDWSDRNRNGRTPGKKLSVNHSTSNETYYGPSSTTTEPKRGVQFGKNQAYSRSQQEVPVSDDYYGPSLSTNNLKPAFSTNHSFENRNVGRSNDDYYGPISSQSSKTTLSPSNSFDQQSPENNSNEVTTAEDYIPLVANKKKRKIVDKNAGFNQTSTALGNRAKRFAGKGGLASASSSANTVPGFDRYMGKQMIGGSGRKLDDTDFERMTVKGTSQTLEKDYLRLTAPPKAELVRPQPVLEKHLQNLKAERKRSNRRDYLWFCSQFKAMRQDCTVQRLQNAFAVDVYETHARVALEEGDLNEYNQCQTQLKELYLQLEGDKDALKNRNEFLAYRIIYYVFLMGNDKYDGGSSDLFKIMLSLTDKDRQDVSIQHALKVRGAVADTDYNYFFRLRVACPGHGSYLMDRIVPSMRHKALLRICKAYRPTADVLFVLSQLGFSVDSAEDVEWGKKYLISCGCVLSDDGMEVKSKDCVVRESDMEGKKSLI